MLRSRQALNHGFRQIKERPLATGVFIEIAQRIKQTEFSIRRTPGTRIANSRDETIYTPPEGEDIIRDKLRFVWTTCPPHEAGRRGEAGHAAA